MAKQAEKTEKEKSQAPATTDKKQSTDVAKFEETASKRFTEMVKREFEGRSGTLMLTDFQKRLIQNYFISIDIALKMADDKRMNKAESNRDAVSVTWNNVNMESLAIDVVAFSRIGYDPALPNHINMIPYKNNRTGKYDIGFIEGYRGLELRAKKYGFDVPDDVIVEVVHENDKFIPLKKDVQNDIESYTYKIAEDPFNRGGIKGGFYYLVHFDRPQKNTLKFYSLAEIEKRKPKYASTEFWGGDKTVWKNGKPAGTEHVDGWFEEMIWKTLYRMAFNSITVDSQKVDDAFMSVLRSDAVRQDAIESKGERTKDAARRLVEDNAHAEHIDMDDAEYEDVTTQQQPEQKQPEQPQKQPEKQPKPQQEPQGEPAMKSKQETKAPEGQQGSSAQPGRMF